MTNAIELKNEIDKNQKNGIEVKEIEEFLQSEENIKRLGEALSSNIDSALLNEFHTAISELCDKMPKIEKCTLNQYKIILFYLNNFKPAESADQKNKLVKTYNKVEKKLNKAVMDYVKKLHKGEEIKGPIPEFERETKKALREKIQKEIEEYVKKHKPDPLQTMGELLNKAYEEREKEEWETSKQKIQSILNKGGALTEDEKNELLKFKTKYYEYHKNYNNSNDRSIKSKKILSNFKPNEEYDEIATKIDKKINSESFNYINDIVSKGEISSKIDIKGLGIINQWIKNFGDTTSENHANKEKLKEIISKEIQKITNKNLKNVDLNKLNQYQIGIFQLRANIEYGENLKINGKKSSLSNKGEISEGEITTLYIYRQWLSVRESKKYPNIEKIPNINELLSSIDDNTQMNKTFRSFLVEIFLPIKNDKYGPTIENMIEGAYKDAGQTGPFGRLLINLINKYICDTTGFSNFKAEGERKGEEVTIGDYLNKMIKGTKEELNDMQKKGDKNEQERIKEEKRLKRLEKQMKTLRGAEKTMNEISKNVNTLLKLVEEPGRNVNNAKEVFQNILDKLGKFPVGNEELEVKQRNELRNHQIGILKQVVSLMHIFFTYDTIGSEFGTKIAKLAKLQDKARILEYKDNNRQIDLLKQIDINQRHAWYFDFERPRYNSNISLFDFNNTDYYQKNGIKLSIKVPAGVIDNSHIKNNMPIGFFGGKNFKAEPIFNSYRKNGKFGLGCMLMAAELYFKFDDCDKIKNLIDRANRGEILLCFDLKSSGTQNNPVSLRNFAIATPTKEGYSLVWQESNTKETINKKKLYNVESNFHTAVFADREVRNGIETLQNFGNLMDNIQKLVDIGMENNKVTSDLYKKVLGYSETLLNCKNTLKKYGYCKRIIAELKNQKQANQFKNSTDENFENLIKSLETLDGMINGSIIDDFYKMLHQEGNFHENDTFFKRAWNRIKNNGLAIICGIAAAVAAVLIIPTGGQSGRLIPLLINGAIMSIGGMVGAAAGTYRNNRLDRATGDKKIELPDGSFTTVHGQKGTTNLGQLYRAIQNGDKEKIGECFGDVLEEWAIGTITTAAFMGAGKLAGNRLTTLAPKSKAIAFLKKIPYNKLEIPDTATNTLNSIGNSTKNIALRKVKQFRGETIEEIREETFETAAENSNIPGLAFTVQLWHSLSPKSHPKVYADNKVTFENIDIQGNNITMDLLYDNTSIDGLKEHFEELGYSFNEKANTFSKQNDKNENYTNVIKLVETKQPFEKRVHVSELEQYGIKMNHETGKIYCMNPNSLFSLQQVWAKSGKGVVTIDENNGSAKLKTGDITLDIYFDGKSHQFEVTEIQARGNSKMMDILLNEINEQHKSEKLDGLREQITEQYKQSTGEELQLTDEQLLSILDAHEQDGILGELTLGQLKQKVKTLDKTITDSTLRRFLFEAGFCGKTGGSSTENDTSSETKLVNHNEKIQELKKGDIINIIEENSGIKLEELSANDLRLLMFKACNMGLDSMTIEKLGVEIQHSIRNNPKINSNTKTELKNYINYLCYITEINNVNINEDSNRIEVALDGIQQQIDISFKENPTMAKELSIEINKKKFELYKKNGNIEQAQNIVNQIREQNTELLSDDTTNFRYRRGLLETDLLEIQLGGEGGKKALEGLRINAQEIWKKTETIGGRTDTETLISKIEAGILLGKSTEELQPYLDFLALTEHGAGVEILGAVIQTINTTFEGADGLLKEYAENVNEAGKKSNDTKLLEAGNKARQISETYNKMKNDLDNDTNRIHHTKIQSRLENFVKERDVSTISDVGNNFSHFTVLLNPQATRNSPVMSIEIGKTDYEAAYKILTEEINIEKLMREGKDYNDFIQKLNSAVDNRIRTTFGTENLQELNSSKHRALFDYIAAKYMEGRRDTQSSSLTNLSQLFGIKGLQDCRLHAFTKQLFFDSWKTNTLNNLEKSRTGNPTTDAEIDKQIKIIENTKMTFLDAQFSGNVDMNTVYVARTEGGYMTRGSQNNVIEEHTFNLIEMPVLDTDGNIQYNEDGTIKKKACFADSFYHGNDGKVYNLSYTGEDISQSIYGKKGEEVYMTTTVTGADGKPIQINIKPLTRSMKGRGDNIVGSSIETRGPSTTEAVTLNAQYDEGLKTVEVLNKNQTEIQSNLKSQLDKLKSGQKVDLTDIEKALTSTEGHKVAQRQANQIKRAFELFEKVPADKEAEAIISLQTMIANTVTQQEIDYAGKTGSATEFLQTEGVFFDKMKVFNEIYKAKIEEAIKQLDPNDPESIKRLQDVIKEYQEIYDSDMKDFFERSQQTMLDDGKRGEEYHRNNFEHVAKRFQNDMKEYAKTVKELESLGVYEQAFEIRKYMVDQGNTLLEHSDKLLGHMIDFKKVKKEMKGIEGREVYIQLLEIQGKGIKDIEAELKKRGMDPIKIKEMVGLKGKDENGVEFDKGWSNETINEAITYIEESGLKEYYDTIALVFTPEILAINMENAVYSKGGYKVETLFNTETKEEYIARKKAEDEIANQIDKNTKPGQIEQIISNQILEKIDPTLLTGKSKTAIQAEIQHLADLCSECGIDGQKTYDICKKATEALIFQTAESQTRVMGDHGINHISGNIKKLNIYLEAGVRGGKISENEIGKYKLMGALTHIFHDIGYAATISKGSGSFDGSAIHSFTSKAFFDSIVKPMLSDVEINANLISKGIEAHDGTRLHFSKPETTFLSMVNLSDNMALGVDKMAQLWSNPKLLNHIATLYALDAAGIELKESNKIIAENIRKDSSITPAEQVSLISAVNELSGRGLDNIDFWSISPLTAMEFSGDVPTLSMYKGADLMLVAEVCGIDGAELETAIKNKDRNTITSLIKGTKFCSQIVKPLGDYADNYQIMDSNGHEYPKTNGKYDMDEIKADLLLGNTVSLNDGKGTVLNYRYESATDESVLAEKNSVYGHIDTAEMLGKGVEAMKRLNTTAIINELGSLNKTTKGILDKIKNTETIDTKKTIESIDKTMKNIGEALTSGDITVNFDFESRFKHFQEDVTLFKTYLNENKYSELKVAAETIQEEIEMLSSFLVKE